MQSSLKLGEHALHFLVALAQFLLAALRKGENLLDWLWLIHESGSHEHNCGNSSIDASTLEQVVIGDLFEKVKRFSNSCFFDVQTWSHLFYACMSFYYYFVLPCHRSSLAPKHRFFGSCAFNHRAQSEVTHVRIEFTADTVLVVLTTPTILIREVTPFWSFIDDSRLLNQTTISTYNCALGSVRDKLVLLAFLTPVLSYRT